MIAADAMAALAVFAVEPLGAGLILQGAPCPARDVILTSLQVASPDMSWRRVPCHVALDRLTGGLDLTASIAAGREVKQSSLLDRAAQSVLVLAMAERWEGQRAALVAAALDEGSIGIVALDEGASTEECLNAMLVDRISFRIALTALPDDFTAALDGSAIRAARAALPAVRVNEEIVGALCRAAEALGVAPLRACLMAVRCARIAAALAGRCDVGADDAALAARLVLAPRATQRPAEPLQEEEPAPDPGQDPSAADTEPETDTGRQDAALDQLVLDATRVVLPANLLGALGGAGPRTSRSAGRAGIMAAGRVRGRPAGSRAGTPREGQRLDLVATLRAAAPWQRLRGRTEPDELLRVRRGDLHVVRCRPKTATITIFAVDASGSLALSRLADAKGAVELLLSECYVRRDSVALVAFRGPAADLLLPPTRAPARARRCLAGLAGGGGTPLAAGILAAAELADGAVRRGQTPTIVLLTDGQANIGRSGQPGREAARLDALEAARSVRAHGHRVLLIDTAPRRQPLAQALAETMGGRYIPLPRADAQSMSAVVRESRG